MGNLDDALRYFETALAINPNRFDAPMYLMHIYSTLGRSADAARTQAAYERVDQGIGLSSEAINAIRRFVTKSSIQEKRKRKGWQFWKR
jgi:tetratricopeptide (TPR) repeat protein